MEPSNPGESNALLFQMGIDYLQSAKNLEGKGKIDQAYKYYREAANKFFYVLKNEDRPSKQKELKDLADKAIDSALWVK